MSSVVSEIKQLIMTDWSSYEEAKARSEKIDQLLGVQTQATEILLNSHKQESQSWSHLSVQSFQTPYPELYQITQQFNDSGLSWIDFGSAYGRLGLVLDWFRPKDRWLGYEFSEERVQEGNRILSMWCSLEPRILKQDLRCDFQIADFDVAFIYDFGLVSEIEELLLKLQLRAKRRPMSVVARGRGTRHLIETHHAWLSQVIEPFHQTHWSLYRSHENSAGRTR